MTSSGIRIGAWDYLRWGNIQPIEEEGKTVAAKIIVYAGELLTKIKDEDALMTLSYLNDFEIG
jgi:hypothetical protein